MKQIDLNGSWEMVPVQGGEKILAQIPGSVASTLLQHKAMPDPYILDNEAKVQKVFENDYIFSRSFIVRPVDLEQDRLLLHCDGLDTLAEISINGIFLGSANNMHRTWIFDAKPLLKAGENTIAIQFSSPIGYLSAHGARVGKGFSVLRKAACMFGWDWGLSLPDSGIWRDIYFESFSGGKIQHVRVNQNHTATGVEVSILPQLDVWNENTQIAVCLRSPGGTVVLQEKAPSGAEAPFIVRIPDPQLWWPSGYGEQPLYTLEVQLLQGTQVLDEKSFCIGLRTIRLSREGDKVGSKYQFIVNDMPVFIRGESMIIENSILSYTTPDRWEKMIQNCIASNLNCLRVWGGAYYPPDLFYELCDKYGLLVYQDFMFACSFYLIDQEFLGNVKGELEDNLKRIANHPCIGLYCGNNEIDCLYTVAGSDDPETVALREFFGSQKASPEALGLLQQIYKPLFLELIPALCKAYAPQTDYVHSSPSLSNPFEASKLTDYLSGGDMHYYLQYNGNAPYEKMRTLHSRFITEMGFQSYPSVKTIHAFALQEDIGPNSELMQYHQKCRDGNETIETYMRRDYIVPDTLEEYVYLSQLQAGEIMKYSIEHFRRDSQYCSGVITWQLNDCWPVVSWSGIDYYGRWKAAQYYTKRYFAPILVSAIQEGLHVELWVSNSSPEVFTGSLEWFLKDSKGTMVKKGQVPVSAQASNSQAYAILDFSDIISRGDEGKYYLQYSLSQNGAQISDSSTLFVKANQFAFEKAVIDLQVSEEDTFYSIRLSSSCYAKGVMLDTAKGDCIFSDNWLDLFPGEEKQVTIRKEDTTDIANLQILRDTLFTSCLNQIMGS